MTSNPNLVLKPVVDKNGVTSARWVKPEQSISASTIPRVSAPAPVMTQAQKRVSTSGSLYKLFHDVDEDMYNFDELTTVMKHMDDRTLEVMLAYVTVDGEDASYPRVEQACEWLVQYDDRDESYLRELFTYRDVFDELVDVQFIEVAVKRLHKCVDLPPMDDYSEADPATKERVIQVLRKAENRYATLFDTGKLEHMVLGERMLKVMADNPDRLDDIHAIMEERDTEDPDLILSIINSDAPALSEGTL